VRQICPEEAVAVTVGDQRGLAQEGLHAEAAVNEELAGRGPWACIHEDVLGEENHLNMRKTCVEDGQDEREDHDLAGFRVESASSY